MFTRKQILVYLLCCACAALVAARAGPDSGDHVPLPGPGLSYGGIPYGSMSGNVAEFFKRQAAPSGRDGNYAPEVDFAPIEQWLR